VLTLELVRRQQDLSQAALACLTGLTQVFISMIERGVALPTPEQHQKLAEVLGVPPDRLLQPFENSDDTP
jgi:transcriptional regulator with XRE-family HTH domain